MHFKIGDTVIYRVHPDWGKGVIKYYEGGFYGIEFVKPQSWFHSCNDYVKKNHGYWLPDDVLRLVKPELPPKEAVCVKIKDIQKRRKEQGYAY